VVNLSTPSTGGSSASGFGRVDQRLAGEVVDARKLDHFFGDAAKDGEHDDIAEPRSLGEGASLGPGLLARHA
jgi:hypothetical protein